MSLAPPDGWSVTSGVWGTNLDIDTSQYVTGLASLRLSYDATTAVPEIYSPWIPIANTNNVPSGRVFYVPRVRIRSSSIAAGNTVTAQFIQYQQDRTTLTNTNTIFSSILNAANTWEEYGTPYDNSATNSAWGRFRLTKANNNFNAWFDEVHIGEAPPYFLGQGSATALTNGAWTPVNLVIGYQNPSYMVLNGNTDVRIHQPGMYSFYATPAVTNLVDGELVSSQIWDVTGGVEVARSHLITGAAGTMTIPVSGVFPVSIVSSGGAVGAFRAFQLRIYANNAGRGISINTRFSIIKNK